MFLAPEHRVVYKRGGWYWRCCYGCHGCSGVLFGPFPTEEAAAEARSNNVFSAASTNGSPEMKTPHYSYTAEGPCFKITSDTPFVLQGCSCGWPSKGCCLRFHGRTERERNANYQATALYAERGISRSSE